MNNNKSQLEKRMKVCRVMFVGGVIVMTIFLAELFFFPHDNHRLFTNGLQLILWTGITIIDWFQLKKAKKQLKESI